MNRLARRALALFDPRGRLSAPAFRRALVRLMLVFSGLVCLSVWFASFVLRGPAVLAFASLPLVGLAALAGASRRLHDRDRTGWWLGLSVLMEALSMLPLDQAVETHPLPVLGVVAAMLGYFAWFCIETVLRPGTPGPNRYGPAPNGVPA